MCLSAASHRANLPTDSHPTVRTEKGCEGLGKRRKHTYAVPLAVLKYQQEVLDYEEDGCVS